ncbi:hypothetical protein [Okeania hirsuta]|nr:hypothetical protein [Okeania hirsuta]
MSDTGDATDTGIKMMPRMPDTDDATDTGIKKMMSRMSDTGDATDTGIKMMPRMPDTDDATDTGIKMMPRIHGSKDWLICISVAKSWSSYRGWRLCQNSFRFFS